MMASCKKHLPALCKFLLKCLLPQDAVPQIQIQAKIKLRNVWT